MEIRDQAVNHLEFVSRIDKNIRPVIVLANFAAFLCDRFNRAAARSADSDHASAVFLRLVDGIGSLFRHVIMLAMHFVVENVIHAHRAERAKADMQCDEHDLHAF